MARQARHRSLVALARRVALAGCGTSKDEGISGGGKVIGHTVTVYSLTSIRAAPAATSSTARSSRSPTRAAAPARSRSTSARSTSAAPDEKLQAEAARRAISDPQIIAAIVDATPVTVPLFNAAGHPAGRAERRPEPGDRPAGAAVRQRTVGDAADERRARRLRRALRGGVRPRTGALGRDGLPRDAGRPAGDRRRGRGRQRPHPRHRRLLRA